MEMTDHIERVNRKMFQKIRSTSDYLAVFFCNCLFILTIRTRELEWCVFFLNLLHPR